MKLIKPYTTDLDTLVSNGDILRLDGNRAWFNTIFPASTPIQQLSTYDPSRIITQVDDSIFDGFVIMQKPNDTVYLDPTKRDYIKTIEIGSFTDSVKRYTNLNKAIDYTREAQTFAKLPAIDFDMVNKLNVKKDLQYEILNIQEQPKQVDPFTNPVNHPHINAPVAPKEAFKYNDKTTLMEVIRWAKERGIVYIYAILEYRPFIMSNEFVTNCVYYTIRGQYGKPITQVQQDLKTNIITNDGNDFQDSSGNDIVYI